jgi:hypothetical protein
LGFPPVEARAILRGASKKVSNTPLRLKRQKRFQMLFQEPNSAGSARHGPGSGNRWRYGAKSTTDEAI